MLCAVLCCATDDRSLLFLWYLWYHSLDTLDVNVWRYAFELIAAQTWNFKISNLSSAWSDCPPLKFVYLIRQKNSSNLNQHEEGEKAKTTGWQGAQYLSRRNQYMHLQVDFTTSCCCGKRRGFGNVVDGTMGHGFEK